MHFSVQVHDSLWRDHVDKRIAQIAGVLKIYRQIQKIIRSRNTRLLVELVQHHLTGVSDM